MNLAFDLSNVEQAEFGMAMDTPEGQEYVAVPVDIGVQTALQEMASATWSAMKKDSDSPSRYQPSEKYASREYLYIQLTDELAAPLRALHEAENLELNSSALNDLSRVFCYFARLTDKYGQRLTALRRATQFKGVLKSKNRLVRMLDDTLAIIKDEVFKLDNDYDLLIDSSHIHIFRPSGFEFAGRLQQAVLDAVPTNIAAISSHLTFVDFSAVEAYAGRHPRAARYLASILANGCENIDKSLLKKLCKKTQVEVRESKGKVCIAEGHEMAFLEVLDRRRYEVSLVRQEPERFRAGSRKKI